NHWVTPVVDIATSSDFYVKSPQCGYIGVAGTLNIYLDGLRLKFQKFRLSGARYFYIHLLTAATEDQKTRTGNFCFNIISINIGCNGPRSSDLQFNSGSKKGVFPHNIART